MMKEPTAPPSYAPGNSAPNAVNQQQQPAAVYVSQQQYFPSHPPAGQQSQQQAHVYVQNNANQTYPPPANAYAYNNSSISTPGFENSVAAQQANNLMRICGVSGITCLIVSVALCTYVGAGPQIGSIIGGVACFVAGLCVSCCVHNRLNYQIRGWVLLLFSLLALGCGIGAYRYYGDLQACATEESSFYSTYVYSGNSAYFDDAANCAAGDTFAWDDCNCVNSSDQCFTVSFTSSCQRILDEAPALAKGVLALGVIMLFTTLLSLFIITNSVNDDKMVPLSSTLLPNQTNSVMTSYPPSNEYSSGGAYPAVAVAEPVMAVPVYNQY